MIVDGTWTPGAVEISSEVQAQFARLHGGLLTYLDRVDANFARWREAALASVDSNKRRAFALMVQAAKPADQSPAYFQLWEGKAATAARWLEQLAGAKKLSDGTLDGILEKIDLLPHGEVSQVF